MFTTFINNKLDKLVTPKELLLGEENVIGKLSRSIGKGDSYRADIASILATRVANFAVVYSKDNKINVVVTSELFYDSFDYNVEGYDKQEFYTIPAHYTAYRHFYNDIMSGADCPTHIKIIKGESCKQD